tara:strand:- start:1028 stop:1204 length:177 start_codon:yes stop_codon:yes gene_type:complete
LVYGILKKVYLLYTNRIRLFSYTFYSPLFDPEAFQLDVKIIPDDDETKLSNGFIYIYQ